jgi:hypothetical protein
MYLDDGRTRSFWRSKRCWSRLASRAIAPTAGVPTKSGESAKIDGVCKLELWQRPLREKFARQHLRLQNIIGFMRGGVRRGRLFQTHAGS